MIGGERRQLEELGYVVLDRFMSPDILWELRSRVGELFDREGDSAGSEFRIEPNARRLANLVAKGPIFEKIVCNPEILHHVASVIGPNFKLSSLNARCANPRSYSRQPLHVDMGVLPDENGYRVCNAIWLLDDFNERNGALRVVPGSHHSGKLPQQAVDDPLAPLPDEMLLTASAGTVLVINSHLWHGGTENETDMPRRALHAFYCRSDLPQQQYQKVCIPGEVQARFGPELRRVLALDDPANDQLSAETAPASGFLR